MKKKYYNVDYTRVEKFSVSVTVEADNENEAIEKVKAGDYMGQEIVSDGEIVDEHSFDATADESGM